MFEENGRRAGDWMHRDLRARAADERHEEAEREREQRKQEGTQWYQQTFWIVFLVVVFWPIGLYLAWKSDWPIAGKILATALVAAILVFIFIQSAITGQNLV